MLSEQRILKSITINNPSNTVEVLWADQVLRDNAVIAETYHRCAYGADEKDKFLSEVDGAQAYIAILGW